MAKVPILESSLNAVAATWDRHTAAETLTDPRGVPIARFEFDPPYETDEGRVFDSALVWYDETGAVTLIKRGLKENLAREVSLLQQMFTRRTR